MRYHPGRKIPATLVGFLHPRFHPTKKLSKLYLFVVPVTHLLTHRLFLAAFQDLLHLFVLVHWVFLSPPRYFWHLLHLFVFGSSRHSPFLHYSFPPEIAMQSCPQLFKGRALKVHDKIPPHSYCLYPDRPPADSHP